MITITLLVFLMILSSVAEIFRVYLGIPEITVLTNFMNVIVMLVLAIKFSVILIAFLVQQYDRSKHAIH